MKMQEQISAAVKFVLKLIRQNSKICKVDLTKFESFLTVGLAQKFESHWHPEKPWLGQGFRCIRVNGHNSYEPTIAKAAEESGIKYADLKLPLELTVWVDPNEVVCRFGEHKGSYCTVASFKDGQECSDDDKDSLDSFSSCSESSPTPMKSSPSKKKTSFNATKENISPSSNSRRRLFSPDNTSMNYSSFKPSPNYHYNNYDNSRWINHNPYQSCSNSPYYRVYSPNGPNFDRSSSPGTWSSPYQYGRPSFYGLQQPQVANV